MMSSKVVNHVSCPFISEHYHAVIPDFVDATLCDVPQFGQVNTIQFTTYGIFVALLDLA